MVFPDKNPNPGKLFYIFVSIVDEELIEGLNRINLAGVIF